MVIVVLAIIINTKYYLYFSEEPNFNVSENSSRTAPAQIPLIEPAKKTIPHFGGVAIVHAKPASSQQERLRL